MGNSIVNRKSANRITGSFGSPNNGDVLTYDAAQQKYVPLAGGAGSTLYTADGTLTGNRILKLGTSTAKTLSFTNQLDENIFRFEAQGASQRQARLSLFSNTLEACRVSSVSNEQSFINGKTNIGSNDATDYGAELAVVKTSGGRFKTLNSNGELITMYNSGDRPVIDWKIAGGATVYNRIGVLSGGNNFLTLNTGIGYNSSNAGSIASRLQVKGSGSTSGTTALLVQNSLSTNLLEVLDDGKTGINAPSPLWALHVKGINGDANIAEFQTWQGVPIMAVVDTGVAVNSATMLGGDATTKLSVSGKIYCNNDIQGTKFYAGAEIAGVTANFEGGTTASLRINGNFHQDSGPSGYGYFKNLSVGTGAAPTSKLQVKGSGSTSATTSLLVQNSLSTNLLEVLDDGVSTFRGTATGEILRVENSLGNRVFRVAQDGTSNDGTLQIYDDTGVTTLINLNGLHDTFNTGNNFGINTSTPLKDFHVQASANGNGIYCYGAGTESSKPSGFLRHVNNASAMGGALGIYRNDGTTLAVSMGGNSATVSYIDDDNDFGIGTVTPTAKLHVNGSLTATNGTADTLKVTTSNVEGYRALVGNGISFRLQDIGEYSRFELFSDAGRNSRLTSQNGGLNYIYNSTTFGRVGGLDGTVAVYNGSGGTVKGYGSSLTVPTFQLTGSTGGNGKLILKKTSSDETMVNLIGGNGASDKNWIYQYMGVGFLNGTGITSQFQVKGKGSTSGTTALLVQNSLGTDLLEVKDDGTTQINGTTSVKNAGSTGTTVFEAEGIGTFPLMKVSTENDAFRPLFTLSNPNTGVNFVKLSGWTDNYIASNIGFGFTSGDAVNIDSNFRIHSNGRVRIDSSGSHTNPLIEIGQDPLDAIRPELLMSISTSGTGVVRFGGSAAANYVAGNTGFGFDSTTSAGINAKLHVNGSTLLDGNLGLFGTTPIAQPTTAGGSALLSTGGGTGLTDTDTFDGYTLQQVVKALRDLGILA